MSELRKHIIDTFGFSETEYESIQTFFKPLRIKKGEYFLEQGKSVRQLGFVENGILREFLYTNDKEVTKWFSTSGYFAVDLLGFLYSQKSKVSYQALNDTSLLTISKDDYDRIGAAIFRNSEDNILPFSKNTINFTPTHDGSIDIEETSDSYAGMIGFNFGEGRVIVCTDQGIFRSLDLLIDGEKIPVTIHDPDCDNADLFLNSIRWLAKLQ